MSCVFEVLVPQPDCEDRHDYDQEGCEEEVLNDLAGCEGKAEAGLETGYRK